jgi:peptidoglycan hydrolase-like protein with peptidoglycan-binding domain
MAIPDDFDPKPTVFTGGLPRMIGLWEASRDANDGGYGGSVLQKIRGWGTPGSSRATSCSPFTGTVIGMMFDPRGGEDAGATYEPKCDDGRLALPVEFYMLHNGFYFQVDKDDPDPKVVARSQAIVDARKRRFREHHWPLCDDSAASTVFFNLGYAIDPRDLRRGDLIGIDWVSGHGHATFCWDVHLDSTGAVDCFSFLSANGMKKNGQYIGAGVSISTSNVDHFIKQDGKKYKKLDTIFADKPDNIQFGKWYCPPHVTRGSVDLKTFKDPTPVPKNIVDASAAYGSGVGTMRAVRFWGFPPPEQPHGTILTADKAALAHQLAKWPSPPSYASGSGTPPKGLVVEKAPVAQVPKSHPDPVKAAPPPPPVQQKPRQVVGHQHFVEAALAELHSAGWIDRAPGKADSVADSATKAAVQDFQTKLKCPPVDGIAGPITRAALKQALVDLHANKPNPNKPSTKPVIDHFYWLSNRVEPGGTNGLAVHGERLELFQTFEITLTDQVSKRSSTLPVPLVAVAGAGVQAVAIPAVFGRGSILTARLRGTASGTILDKVSDVPLYVGQVVAPPTGDWPWDEAKWTPIMRNVVAELRATPRGPGNYHRREITQYGVKEKIAPGDIPVLDKAGRELGRVDKRSLYLADIEGTMRLNGRILNIVKSGNVYDQQVTRVIGGVAVKKPKPSLDKFDPARSRWVDVTDRAPWGSGAKLPLIPFRVLAHNPKSETPLYGRIVYIRQLDGLMLSTGENHNGMCIVGDCGGMAPAGAQFDFFIGREDHHIAIPTLARSQGGSVCEVEILGASTAARR